MLLGVTVTRALLLMVLALALAGCGPAESDDGPDAGTSAEQAETDEPAEATEPDPGSEADGEPEDEAGEGAGDAAPAEAGQGVTLLTPIFALAWMAEEIAPAADVEFLLAGGGDPHGLELSPSERALLETAEVVAYAGDLGFMPQFESAVDSAAGQVVDLEQVAGEERVMRFDHGHDDDDHTDDDHTDDDHTDDDHTDDDHTDDDHADDDHADDDHTDDDHTDDDHTDDDHTDDDHADDDHADDDHADDDHDHGELADPHLWFDTTVMADAAVELGDAFAAADPDNADAFRENASAVAAEMEELTDEVDSRLAGCTHDAVIVSHEAYGYLLEPRGIEQEGISGAGGHAEASPQRLAELSERISAEEIPAVAAEPLHGRADAEALAAEAGVDLVEINPLEDVSDDEYERGYPQMLLDQVDAFAAALECEGA